MTRYTLTYTTTRGARLALYNLLSAACDEIERAQRVLGSTAFKREAQPHNYSQDELDLMRKGKP